MRKYEQLIVAEQSAELTNDEREFVEVHRRIVASGEMTGRYLFEMCNQIKRMHDTPRCALRPNRRRKRARK